MQHNATASADFRSSWYQWTLAVLVVATLAFGARGYWLYEHTTHPELPPEAPSIAYHTLQLLIAHAPHLDRHIPDVEIDIEPAPIARGPYMGVPLPWQLHVGRFCGVAVLFTAGMIAFLKFFREEMLLFRLRWPWRWGHVVICGLGDMGLRLALDGRHLRPRKFREDLLLGKSRKRPTRRQPILN